MRKKGLTFIGMPTDLGIMSRPCSAWPLVNRNDKQAVEMGRDIPVVITGSPGRKTIKKSLSLTNLPFCRHADVYLGKSIKLSRELQCLSHPVEVSL